MPDKPFDQLSAADQKAAIDVGICVSVLGTRIPSCGKPLFDYIASEFVASHTLPANIVKYALRQIGQSLFDSNWEFTVKKLGSELITEFKRIGEHDGDSPLSESTIID
jgi:hypothetical protein